MVRIDSYPTHELLGVKYRIGKVLPYGASIVPDGVNFSIFSNRATHCELLLYHYGEEEPYVVIPFPNEFKIGNVYSMIVFDVDYETVEYGYRMDGEYNPENGDRFDRTKVLLDPYAKAISGRTVWGKEPNWDNNFQHRGKIIYDDFDWQGDVPLRLPMSDLVIYEAHVRSLTKHESSGAKYPGTFAGLRDKLPYLKELGINCIELMPIFEFDEFENAREIDGNKLYNYWGYSTVGFFAPKAGYAASAPLGLEVDELKNLIKELHRNGIEVILDVVFNHTAEGNEKGPYISYRGIDNKTYYLLTPEGYYYNFSGCGNTLNCNNSIVRNCILDCLRYWAADYHIDGFRFDLASILSRDERGAPMTSPPLLEILAHDAILSECKLIAEAWDAGGLYQVGSFPAWGRWAEWNGRYRDCVRTFIKGGMEAFPELVQRINGSRDLYGNRSSNASINFITCHDGFSLYDLVSYNEKHNIMNGENNQDGGNDNESWNCGVEGETQDKEILTLRYRQMKNAITLLLMSRGIPMLLSGDEFANTQFGNNNAYCQDNEISWLDWTRLEGHKDLHDYVQKLIRFRQEHPVLRSDDFFDGKNATDYPEFSLHGEQPWQIDVTQPTLTFGFMFVEEKEKYKQKTDNFIYVAVNAHWESRTFHLPTVPAGKRWKLLISSNTEKVVQNDDMSINVADRSMVILLA